MCESKGVGVKKIGHEEISVMGNQIFAFDDDDFGILLQFPAHGFPIVLQGAVAFLGSGSVSSPDGKQNKDLSTFMGTSQPLKKFFRRCLSSSDGTWLQSFVPYATVTRSALTG